MTDATALRNVALAEQVDWPVSGFESDPNFPLTSVGSIWRDWLKYLLDGTLPPGTRVYCGVAVPDFPLAPAN